MRPLNPISSLCDRRAVHLDEFRLESRRPREASLRTGQGEALGRALGWDVSMLIQAGGFVRQIERRGGWLVEGGEFHGGAAVFLLNAKARSSAKSAKRTF